MSAFYRAALLLVLGVIPTSVWSAYGPDHVFPTFNTIRIDGNAVVLGGEVRLTGGRFGNWPDPAYNSHNNARWAQRPPQNDCGVPKDLLVLGKNSWDTRRQVLFCGNNRVWLASEGTCQEGADVHAQLFSFVPGAKVLTPHRGWIPHCETATSALEMHGRVWLASDHPQEASDPATGAGIIVYDIQRGVRLMNEPMPTDLGVVRAMAHDARANRVWVTTVTGVHRYSVSKRHWDSRYFHLKMEHDELRVGLERRPQARNAHAALVAFYFLPMPRKPAFLKAYLRKPRQLLLDWLGLSHDRDLLPYYLEMFASNPPLWERDPYRLDAGAKAKFDRIGADPYQYRNLFRELHRLLNMTEVELSAELKRLGGLEAEQRFTAAAALVDKHRPQQND